MQRPDSARKAERLRQLHHGPQLLVLPNIWDPLGARLLESLDYPAVATASAAVAFSQGLDDGQQIRFDRVLDIVGRIAASVRVPVTADIEGGYAEAPADLAENVHRVIEAGAVGINLEDTRFDREGGLHDVAFHQERVRAVRTMADRVGVPLVINARTDVFLLDGPETMDVRLAEATRRARAYVEAGADCVYPITLDDLDSLRNLHDEIEAPINVYAGPSTPSMPELESAGVRRLSVGPGLLRAALTTMRDVARGLRDRGGYDAMTRDAISSEEIREILFRDRTV